jgi:hypothetical protein
MDQIPLSRERGSVEGAQASKARHRGMSRRLNHTDTSGLELSDDFTAVNAAQTPPGVHVHVF